MLPDSTWLSLALPLAVVGLILVKMPYIEEELGDRDGSSTLSLIDHRTRVCQFADEGPGIGSQRSATG